LITNLFYPKFLRIFAYMNKEKLISHYLQNVRETKHQELLSKIIDYILDERVKEVRFSSLYRYFNEKYSKEDILFIIQKLILGKYKLLDIAYTFYDDENIEKSFSLTKKQFKEVEKNNSYIHPDTGEIIPIDIFRKNTTFYFIPQRNFLSSVVTS